jgi:hypothetical protein
VSRSTIGYRGGWLGADDAVRTVSFPCLLLPLAFWRELVTAATVLVNDEQVTSKFAVDLKGRRWRS